MAIVQITNTTTEALAHGNIDAGRPRFCPAMAGQATNSPAAATSETRRMQQPRILALRLSNASTERFSDEFAARYGQVYNHMHATHLRRRRVALYVLDALVLAGAFSALFAGEPVLIAIAAGVGTCGSAYSKVVDLKGHEAQCRARSNDFGALLARRHDLDDSAFQQQLSQLQNFDDPSEHRRLCRLAFNQVCDEAGIPEQKRGPAWWLRRDTAPASV